MGLFKSLSPFYLNDHIQKELASGGIFESLKSPFPSLKNFNLIQFRQNVEGVGIVYGLGKSKNLKQAKIKAYFEFLERKALLTSKDSNLTTSNGISAHKFELLARKSARDELFERDSFLAHWYAKRGFKETEIRKNSFYSDISKDLNKINFSCRIGVTDFGFQKTYCAFLINESTGGFCIGTSSGKGMKADSLKAVLEAIISLSFGNYGKNTETLLSQLDQKGFNDLEMHRAFWLYKGQLPEWIFVKKYAKNANLRSNLDPRVNYFLLSKEPYPVVVARSNETFPFRPGYPNSKEQEILTLRTKIRYVIDETLPHPIF